MIKVDMRKVTRVEAINHSKCDNCKGSGKIHVEGQPERFECPACHGMGSLGREVIFDDPNKQMRIDLQDDGRTLKIFITEREK